MFRPVHRGVLATVVVAVLAVAVPAANARPHQVSCGQRPGPTVAENAFVRVYRSRHRVYACRRPGGPPRAVQLDRSERFPGAPASAPAGIQLAGDYVAYEQTVEALSTHEVISVLDVRTGAIREAAFANVDDHESLADDVLDPGGTLVSLSAFVDCLDACLVGSTLVENTPAGKTTTLDSHQVTEPKDTRPTYPITGLALSHSGTLAYWLDDGVARVAQLG